MNVATARDCSFPLRKDGDFNRLAFLFGAQPKVVWIRRGNCSTADIERILRRHHPAIAAFTQDLNSAVIILV